MRLGGDYQNIVFDDCSALVHVAQFAALAAEPTGLAVLRFVSGVTQMPVPEGFAQVTSDIGFRAECLASASQSQFPPKISRPWRRIALGKFQQPVVGLELELDAGSENIVARGALGYLFLALPLACGQPAAIGLPVDFGKSLLPCFSGCKQSVACRYPF